MTQSNFAIGNQAIAICDRCKCKVAYRSLRPDGNSPGLRVCGDGCWDQKDPWRLPRPPEKPISLRKPRPDVQLTLPEGVLIAQDDAYIDSSDPSRLLPGGDN